MQIANCVGEIDFAANKDGLSAGATEAIIRRKAGYLLFTNRDGGGLCPNHSDGLGPNRSDDRGRPYGRGRAHGRPQG